MKVLVTGATGLLGRRLAPYLQQQGHTVFRQSRLAGFEISADLTDFGQIQHALDQAGADVIINLAALTDVDECERRPQKAYLANVRVVENLAHWIREGANGCHLVQISTDQVYDGAGPHKESDVSPGNYYALSKYAGELAALNVGATVLRTNFVGRSQCPGRKTLSDWLVDSFRSGATISTFDDVWFSPLNLARLPRLIALVIQFRVPGVFNLGSREGMTKADFADRLAEAVGLSATNARRRSVHEMNMRAYRPKDMRLDSSFFEDTFHIELPKLEHEITDISVEYRNDLKQ